MEKKKFVNPFALLSFIWVISLGIVESGVIKYIPLSQTFYIVFTCASVVFGVSYGFTRIILRPILIKSIKSRLSRGVEFYNQMNVTWINITFVMVFVLILLHGYNLIKISGGLDIGLYRSLITDGGQSIDFGGMIALLNPFAYMSFVLLFSFNATARQVYIMSFLLVVFFILTTGRSSFLVVILLTGWYLYFKGKIDTKRIIFYSLSFCIFFVSMGVVLGKLDETVGEHMFSFISEDVPRNWFTIALFNLLSYMTSGIVAFSDYADNNIPTFEMYNTGKNFYKILSPLISEPPVFGILPNAFVPFPTNVYTFFFPPYADFGLTGIVVSFIAYGIVGGFLYTLFDVYRTEYYAALLSIFYTVISLSVFHDYAFSSLFPYSTALLIFLLRNKFNRKVS